MPCNKWEKNVKNSLIWSSRRFSEKSKKVLNVETVLIKMFTFVPKRISLLNYLSSRRTVRKVLNYFCEIYNLRYYDSVLFTCLFGIIKKPARKKFLSLNLILKKDFSIKLNLLINGFWKKISKFFGCFSRTFLVLYTFKKRFKIFVNDLRYWSHLVENEFFLSVRQKKDWEFGAYWPVSTREIIWLLCDFSEESLVRRLVRCHKRDFSRIQNFFDLKLFIHQS